MIWLDSQPWFLDFNVFGISTRDLFQVHTINLSVAVWVGFPVLSGIATDDGVIMATHFRQRLTEVAPTTIKGAREAVLLAGRRRIRSCLVTVATTVLPLASGIDLDICRYPRA